MHPRFECHSHSEYSNLRLVDAINKVDKLIDRAVELNLSGVCITEHECLSSHVKAFKHGKKVREKNPDFKLGLGNEIYLCKDRSSGQQYFHFILIAKNKKGYKALKELSSRAWMNSFTDRRMERVVTTYDDLKEITKKYPNSLIGSTACLGGEVSQLTLRLIEAEELGAAPQINEAHEGIVDFMLMCKEIFGEDFYLECQPAQSREQILVNKRFPAIAKAFGVKMIVTCDAHYLKKEDRYVHKAYLNSKEGEREVDEFYQYAYLQSNEEIYDNLEASDYSKDFIDEMFNNTHEIYDKIENFELGHTQVIPKVIPKIYEKMNIFDSQKYPILHELETSDNVIERNWVNECWLGLKREKKEDNEEYLQRLESEADVIKYIGNQIKDCLFSYFVTFKYYIDLFWESGSIVGPGRGSACGFLSNFLLGITQVDPIEWGLADWRFLNKERVELPDIDIDLCPSKRPRIIEKIRKDRKENNLSKDLDEQSREILGCVGVATFGTEETRSTVQTACRGYRSEEFPDGIDNDVALYLASLIPEERGFLWSLNDVLNGNKEKDRKPVRSFIKEVNKYPGLVDIMMGITGLVNKRSSHASGFIFLGDDPYDYSAFMRAPNGDITTQLDLEEAEFEGLTKFDLLVTDISDKIEQTIELLKKDGVIENKSLKEIYYSLLHPKAIDIKDERIWEALGKGSVLNVFQFNTSVGGMAARKIKPKSPLEMTAVNASNWRLHTLPVIAGVSIY